MAKRGKKRRQMNLEKAIEQLKLEYELGCKLEYVRDPLAWALYRVWKMAEENPYGVGS